MFILDSTGGTGVIAYRIAHTARTWGADIDALLSSHIKTVVDDIPPWRKWLAKHEFKIGVLIFCLLFAASIAGAFASSSSFVQTQRAQVEALKSISSLDVTPAQMSYLLETMASGTWERFLLTSVAFLLFSFVVSLGVAIWAGSTADNLPPSFLLLTKESEKQRRKTLNSNRAKLISFFASIGSGLVIGVAGNICYGLWFERLINP